MNIVVEPSPTGLSREAARIILAELARRELGRIIAAQEGGHQVDDDEIDVPIAKLEAENLSLKRDARMHDYAKIEGPVRAAAETVGLTLANVLPNSLGRRAVELLREIMTIEGRMLDGEDGRAVGEGLSERFSPGGVDCFLASRPVLLSECWTQCLVLYPSKDMKGNIDAISKVAIAYFGDVPIASISEDDQKAFFVWMARQPKYHGKKHGKNRYCSDGPMGPARRIASKQDEIDAADAADEEETDCIRDLGHLSNLEKRALLAEKLVPRLTMRTIERNRDGFNRLTKAAGKLGASGVRKLVSLNDIKGGSSQPHRRIRSTSASPSRRSACRGRTNGSPSFCLRHSIRDRSRNTGDPAPVTSSFGTRFNGCR